MNTGSWKRQLRLFTQSRNLGDIEECAHIVLMTSVWGEGNFTSRIVHRRYGYMRVIK